MRRPVNNHLNEVQQVICGDYADLVNTATTLQGGYTTNITDVLPQVHSALQEFQVPMFQRENVTANDVYDNVMFTSLRQQLQLYFSTLMIV